jgi:hypothetical protein
MNTTMYIKQCVLMQISRAASLKDISRSAMIIELLKIILAHTPQAVRIGRLIQYQEREASGEWHTFHISFREDDYEVFQDMRKLRKMSISFLLAEAVKKYLKNVLQKNQTPDNYPHCNYIIIREMIGTIISWRLIWGFPQNLIRILNNKLPDR